MGGWEGTSTAVDAASHGTHDTDVNSPHPPRMPFQLLERRTVSRKTQNDGRLEISPAAAARLGRLPEGLRVELTGRTSPATLDRMACTCRAEGKAHEHYFIQSELLRELATGAEVDLSVDTQFSLIAVRPTQ